jgi:hypothetical protein
LDYLKIYQNIIDDAKSANRKKRKNSDVIYENHHIKPRSVGGSNDTSNLVLLTPKEHFICHLLLVEIYKGTEFYQKMKYSVWCLINGRNRQKRHSPSSRQYDRLRKEFIEMQKIRGKTRGFPENGQKLAVKSNTGAKRSDSAKQKMSDAKVGVKREPWVIEKLKNSFKNRDFKNEIDRNRKISESKKNKPRSSETKAKISASLKGKSSGRKGCKLSNETIEKLKKAKQNISQETRDKMSKSAKSRKIK